MKRSIFVLIFLGTACSGSSSSGHATSSLVLSMGTESPRVLNAEPTYDASGTRLLVTVQQYDSTVFFSLSAPVSTGTRSVESAIELVVWAKNGQGQPLIATTGQVDVVVSDHVASLSTLGLSKPVDGFGESFQLTGNVLGLRVP